MFQTLANESNYERIKTDLNRVVDCVLESHFDDAMQSFYDRWEKSEQGWIKLFKEKFGHLKFYRGLLPAGWPGREMQGYPTNLKN